MVPLEKQILDSQSPEDIREACKAAMQAEGVISRNRSGEVTVESQRVIHRRKVSINGQEFIVTADSPAELDARTRALLFRR